MKKLLAALFSVIMMLSCLATFSVSAADAEQSTVDTESQLYKKSVLFVGDSICEARCEWGKDLVGWPGRIMAYNEMTGDNKGVSGASVSNCRGSNTILAQLAASRSKKYDFVIIHGGVNDAWDAAPVGVMTEGFNAQLDLATFAGGLEATFKYAKQAFKDAQFGYIINFAITRKGIGKLDDMSEYFDMAKLICDKWDIPYIDLYSDEDFNKNVLKNNSTVNVPDLIHPNTAGYDIIAPVINDWMKTLGVTEEEESVEESVEETPAITESSATTEEKGGSANVVIIIVCGVVVVAAIAVAIIVLKKKK